MTKSREMPKVMEGETLFLLLREVSEQAVKNGENKAKRKRPPESVNMKIIYKVVYTENDTRIDHEEKQTQREDGDWNSKQYEDGPNNHV